MKIEFEKYQGAGNDFIIVDNRSACFPISSGLIKRLCDRHFGVGADGLILAEKSCNQDLRMNYYNADGMKATFCGNGGRCLAAWAFDHKIIRNHLRLEADDGIHEAWIEVSDNASFHVILTLNNVVGFTQHNDGYFLNTGTPHFVQPVHELHSLNVYEQGKRLRNDERFLPDGTNVNFLELNQDGLGMRTFEKGVECETLSCGTGAAACAIVAMIIRQESAKWLEINTPGGILTVFAHKLGNSFVNIKLKGLAVKVFTGIIEI